MTKHDPDRPFAILEYVQEHPSATVREIMVAVGLHSTAAVTHHLRSLQRKGLLGVDACRLCGHRAWVAKLVPIAA